MSDGHFTLSAVFACAAIHVGFAAFGLEPVFEALGSGLAAAFSPGA